MQASKRREVDLDVIRGIAILLAMGWHLNNLNVDGLGRVILAPGRIVGWAGVDLFFVLSGFLIGSLIIREIKRDSSFNYPRFIIRRILRLWPTLYIFLFAMLISRSAPWNDFFWQIALHVQNYVKTESATHLWSLAVEEHFYLLFGISIMFCAKYRNWRHILALSLLGILILCPILRVIGVILKFSSVEIQTQTHFRLDALASGVLLSLLSLEYSHVFSKILRLRAFWAILGSISFIIMWFIPKNSVAGETFGYTNSLVWSSCVILSIYKSGIERVAKYPSLAIAFIGQISYPLYLWHVPTYKIGKIYFERLFGKLHPGMETLSIYAVSITIAYFMTKFIEHYFMNLRDKIVPAKVDAVIATQGDGTIKSI